MNTLYDSNTFVGHWPFRQVVNSSASELQKLLESYAIGKALTANMNSIFYKDAHSGNRELHEMIADKRDFFIGVATLNPTYAAWERDLEQCVTEFGFKALRLVPQYHNYTIGDADCLAICKKAAELDIPVLISPTMVDPRQKHWLDIEESIGFKQISELAEKVENLKIVCSGFFFYNIKDYDELSEKTYCERIYFDTSRCLKSAWYQNLAYGVKKLGAQQFMYGSNAPLRGISPSILELECADISDTEKKNIATGTFKRLFMDI